MDQERGTVFTVQMPEEIYGSDGSRITPEKFEKGNIVKIYGNGIMLESYPGQYPGVTKIEVIEKGQPSDADQYQGIVDQLYQEPDPAEPPYLNAEYRTSMAAASVAVTRGAYEWSYIDKEGNTQSVTTDMAHVLEWDEINDMTLEGPTEVKLLFSERPQKVEITRWADSGETAGQADESGSTAQTETGETVTQADGREISDGESVQVQEKDGEYVIGEAEAGYRYLVRGIWENGYVEYGFLTKNSSK